jgi:DNA segregation ATPase FtsK/SpoIIIE-like protein
MTKEKVIQHMQDAKKTSIPFVQRALQISYEKAKTVCDSVMIVKTSKYKESMDAYLMKNNLGHLIK